MKGFLFLSALNVMFLYGQNYLKNGEFSNGSDQWDLAGDGISQASEGYPSPGSLHFQFADLAPKTIRQCGRAVDSGSYFAGVWIKGGSDLAVTIEVGYYEDSQCNIFLSSEILFFNAIPNNDAWTYYEDTLNAVPVGTIGMSLEITLSPTGIGSQANISSAFLGRYPYPGKFRDFDTVIKTGDILPNTNGFPVDAIGLPVVSSNGNLIFTGNTDLNGNEEHFVWVNGNVVWSESQDPNLDGFSLFHAGINDSLDWLYRPSDSNTAILWNQDGAVVKEGEPLTGQTDRYLDNFFNLHVTQDGANYCTAALSETPNGSASHEAIIQIDPAADGTDITVLYQTGQAFDGEFIVDTTNGMGDFSISNNGQHHGLGALLTPSDDFVLIVDGVTISREGQTSNTGRVFRLFSMVDINNQGDYFSSGTFISDQSPLPRTLDGTSISDNFVACNGTVFAQSNGNLGGIDLLEPCSQRVISINNSGQGLIQWLCRNQMLWFYVRDINLPAQTSTLILKSGDALDTNEDDIPDSQVGVPDSSFSIYANAATIADDGTLYITALMDADSAVEAAMITTPAPCVAGTQFFDNLLNWPANDVLSFLPIDCE